MSLSTLSKVLTSIILFFIAIAIGLGGWAWQELEKPEKISRDFNAYQTQFNADVKLLLQRYLSTGDADQLQSAEQLILQLQQRQFDWLSETDNQAIYDTLGQLERSILQVRSAGKLANNPQTLLINNERERLADISALERYVDRAIGQPLTMKQAYLLGLLRLNQSLNQIAHLRQQYFVSPTELALDNISKANQEFLAQLRPILSLPRFGLYTEIDPDELDPDEPEEIGQASLDSLPSLTARYDKELANTIDLQQQNILSREQLNTAMEYTANHLNSYQSQVDQIKLDITNRVKWMMLAVVVFVITAIFVLFNLQNKLVAFLTNFDGFLKRLVKGSYDQKLTSNLSYKEPLSLKQSGEQLQSYFSGLIDQLAQQSQDIVSATGDMQTVSNNTLSLTAKQTHVTNEVASAATDLSHSFKDVAEGASHASTAT